MKQNKNKVPVYYAYVASSPFNGERFDLETLNYESKRIFERPASMGFGHWLNLYEVIIRIEDNQWRAKAKVAVLFLIQEK